MVTLYTENLYNEKQIKNNINLRQVAVINYTKINDKIKNREYQSLNKVSRETATRDLKILI